MNISGIEWESIVDGEGVRVAIFISGCKHNCKGCHNPDTHDFNYGKEFTPEIKDEIINYIKKIPYISGITLSGGDPMYSYKEVIEFIKEFRKELPDKNVWLYTGFTIYDILHSEMNEILGYVDVMIDGVFKEELADPTLEYRGSSNQSIVRIDHTKPYLCIDVNID